MTKKQRITILEQNDVEDHAKMLRFGERLQRQEENLEMLRIHVTDLDLVERLKSLEAALIIERRRIIELEQCRVVDVVDSGDEMRRLDEAFDMILTLEARLEAIKELQGGGTPNTEGNDFADVDALNYESDQAAQTDWENNELLQRIAELQATCFMQRQLLMDVERELEKYHPFDQDTVIANVRKVLHDYLFSGELFWDRFRYEIEYSNLQKELQRARDLSKTEHRPVIIENEKIYLNQNVYDVKNLQTLLENALNTPSEEDTPLD